MASLESSDKLKDANLLSSHSSELTDRSSESETADLQRLERSDFMPLNTHGIISKLSLRFNDKKQDLPSRFFKYLFLTPDPVGCILSLSLGLDGSADHKMHQKIIRAFKDPLYLLCHGQISLLKILSNDDNQSNDVPLNTINSPKVDSAKSHQDPEEYINHINSLKDENCKRFLEMLLSDTSTPSIHLLMAFFDVSLSCNSANESGILGRNDTLHVLGRIKNKADYINQISNFKLHDIVPMEKIYIELAATNDIQSLKVLVVRKLLHDFLTVTKAIIAPVLSPPFLFNARILNIAKAARRLCKELHYEIKSVDSMDHYIVSTISSITFMCDEIGRTVKSTGNPCYSNHEMALSLLDSIHDWIINAAVVDNEKLDAGQICLYTIALNRLLSKTHTSSYAAALKDRLFGGIEIVSRYSVSEIQKIKCYGWFTTTWPITFIDDNHAFDYELYHRKIPSIKRIAVDSEWTDTDIATLQIVFDGEERVFIFDMISLSSDTMRRYLAPFWESDCLFLGIS